MKSGTIQGRLSRLEQRTRGKFRADPGKNCICKRHGFYFVVTDATPEEVKKMIPHNREYCPKCGGKLPVVTVDKDDIREE